MDLREQILEKQRLMKANIASQFTGIYHCDPELEKGGNKHDFSTKEREDLSKKKEAMPNGSFPIRNEQDLKDAIKSYGRAKDREETKSWIKKRAKELDKESLLPKDWIEKSVEENMEENNRHMNTSLHKKLNEDLDNK